MIKLNFNGVQISIIVLIVMLLVCHGTKLYLDNQNNDANRANQENKNNFYNVESKDSTSYNEIDYITNTGLPCTKKPANSCEPKPPCKPSKTGLDTLSESELAVIYKVAYENAGLEVMDRTIKARQKAIEDEKRKKVYRYM